MLVEAEKLVKGGVKELLVISQDTSAYGVDLKYAERAWRGKAYRTRMTELCEGLAELGVWTRLHYVYPYPACGRADAVDGGGENPAVPRHPVPARSPRILKLMKRPGNIDKTLERIRNWRRQVPDLTIRSTFIVGFPARRMRSSRNCSISCARPNSIASARSPPPPPPHPHLPPPPTTPPPAARATRTGNWHDLLNALVWLRHGALKRTSTRARSPRSRTWGRKSAHARNTR
ncbi:tRNA-2-methylthio-N(6)-dimethylallyladenosine synthase [Rhodanobacter lindaniclasticus]